MKSKRGEACVLCGQEPDPQPNEALKALRRLKRQFEDKIENESTFHYEVRIWREADRMVNVLLKQIETGIGVRR